MSRGSTSYSCRSLVEKIALSRGLVSEKDSLAVAFNESCCSFVEFHSVKA